MSEDKIETDVDQTAEAFTDELSDEALDEKEGFLLTFTLPTVCR
jgi:hypothetical protein